MRIDVRIYIYISSKARTTTPNGLRETGLFTRHTLVSCVDFLDSRSQAQEATLSLSLSLSLFLSELASSLSLLRIVDLDIHGDACPHRDLLLSAMKEPAEWKLHEAAA